MCNEKSAIKKTREKYSYQRNDNNVHAFKIQNDRNLLQICLDALLELAFTDKEDCIETRICQKKFLFLSHVLRKKYFQVTKMFSEKSFKQSLFTIFLGIFEVEQEIRV